MAWPIFECSTPALDLYEKLKSGRVGATAEYARRIAGKPRRTVDRYLKELVEARLVLRLRRNFYVIPRSFTKALLLGESSSYHRNLLLYQDSLDDILGSVNSWAFACLAVRDVLDFEIPKALPVFKLNHDVLERYKEQGFFVGGAFHYNFDDAEDIEHRTVTFPSNAEELDNDHEHGLQPIRLQIPIVKPALALAMFASTSDPRIVNAVKKAAEHLGLSKGDVMNRAKRFHSEEAPLRTLYPNTLVLPDWLADFSGTARKMHSAEYLEQTIESFNTSNPDEEEG